MHFYLDYYKELLQDKLSPEEAQMEQKRLLVQIQFFQHERFIHLIVTVLFALMTVITLLANVALQQPILVLLTFMFIILLIPYIKHYYLLENGTQTLYKYYDQLESISLGVQVSDAIL